MLNSKLKFDLPTIKTGPQYSRSAGFFQYSKKILHTRSDTIRKERSFLQRVNIGRKEGNGRPGISKEATEQVKEYSQNDCSTMPYWADKAASNARKEAGG